MSMNPTGPIPKRAQHSSHQTLQHRPCEHFARRVDSPCIVHPKRSARGKANLPDSALLSPAGIGWNESESNIQAGTLACENPGAAVLILRKKVRVHPRRG